MAQNLGNKSGHQCEWYILNSINDSTLGIFIQYFFLKFFEWVFKNSKISFKSGHYGENISFKSYFYQLFIWILIILMVNFILFKNSPNLPTQYF